MHALKPHLTEDQFIASITAALGVPPRALRVGIGDDAAVWKPARSHVSLITTDALTDGVHFRSELTTPQALGHKALAQNLSDIAAMGGKPVLAVVALGVTDVVDEAWARAFYGGMADLAKSAGCAIAGGDVFRSAALTLALTVVGEARPNRVRLRSGARPGDYACVTGPLGLAAAGLQLLRSPGLRSAAGLDETLRRAHELPLPRLREGQYLASLRAVHALMDISDGLSTDLARMARASKADACIDLAALTPSPAIARFPNALEMVLHGGDDYELLAAIEPRALAHVARRFAGRFGRKLQVVGRFEQGTGRVLALKDGERSELAPLGYDHFSKSAD